jgi:predicted SnoaL-like aldol condensation-catalyzing enzyme
VETQVPETNKEAIRMSKMVLLLMATLVLSALGGGSLAAQSKSEQEKNLKVVMDFWRDVLVAHHVDLAPKYLAKSYIQHNPNVATGLDGFVAFFSRFSAQPIPATLPNQPIQVFMKGDFVVLIWDHDGKDPVDPSKTYKYNTFDMFRVDGGLIQAHWDSALKNPPAPPK